MIEADTPSLWEIRQQLGHPATIAIIVKAFLHAARLVNLDKNLTDEQIVETANDILSEYGYLKVEEIKYLLKRALRTRNVYGRLDYNVLMNWVEEYVNERTEEAVRISEQEDLQRQNETSVSADAVSFEQFLLDLEEKAKTDPEAAKLLKKAKEMQRRRHQYLTREEKAQKDHDFKKWFTFSYLLGKKD